jgi:hypothetical protein
VSGVDDDNGDGEMVSGLLASADRFFWSRRDEGGANVVEVNGGDRRDSV